MEETIQSNGITIVNDEFISLTEDLTLLGRVDMTIESRKAGSSLANPYPASYLLVADHEPFEFGSGGVPNVDLQISGHTHAGQLFPLDLFYRFAVPTYGEYHDGNSTLYVSAGASGWRAPLRTVVGCQFDVITLKPAA